MPGRERVGGTVANDRGYSLVEMMVGITITLFIMAGVYGLMIQNQHIYEQQTRLADMQQAARVALDLMTREIRMAGSDPSGTAFDPPACVAAASPFPAYQVPVDPAAPNPEDIAALTVVLPTRIRIKLDRPVFGLGPEPTATPTSTPVVFNDFSGNGLYDLDDETALGDGYLNDPEEDIEYEWVAATKRLMRKIHYGAVPDACRENGAGGTPPPPPGDVFVPIAENIQSFALKYYYAPNPLTDPCPAAGFSGDYETARDACDPPVTPGSVDPSQVRRVRIRLTVEAPKRDALKQKVVTFTLTADASIRNRQ